jgi:hypothetical protein
MFEMATRLACIAAFGAIVTVWPAAASDTGLSVLHELRREGGRVCFLDHYHYGSSAGMGDQRAAKVSAMRSWQDFVDLEYGSDWARFSRAHSKSVKCERSSSGWSCLVEARPCK